MPTFSDAESERPSITIYAIIVELKMRKNINPTKFKYQGKIIQLASKLLKNPNNLTRKKLAWIATVHTL